jgi:hypothetical protein
VKKTIRYLLAVLVLPTISLGQSSLLSPPTDPGMYVEVSGGLIKVIGQIAEFKRSGSLLVYNVTGGLKTRKQNIQLLGAHAQTVVSAQPVFYFIPVKQEAEAGVNAGDLILIRLEEKSKRRQFEIAARGAWRASSGISLTHQVELLREEIGPEIYKILPATELEKGEYALYLSRGEGMAAYVYDFSVQPIHATATKEEQSRRMWNVTDRTATIDSPKVSSLTVGPESSVRASIGAFAEGNLDVRHDGVTLTKVTIGGPADKAGIRIGDTILAINDHYLFTIAELRAQITQLLPGSKITVRYRRYATIYDVILVAQAAQ